MFAIRLYVAGLTLTFLLCALFSKGIAKLEATVIACALLYLILDARKELIELKTLESQVSSLSH
ncbi:MAG: hypothetical protein ABI967_12310 [bacterium]